MTTTSIATLEPTYVFSHFDAFTRIARPSGQEQGMIDYITQWAESKSFEIKSDDAGNICIHVPGSPGHENSPPVILQGHLDMVCERNESSEYDASIGKLRTFIENDWLKADGTTLGADNGIGVALAMAAADDDSVIHPPLDLLFTIDEETGLTGAMKLDPGILRGKTLINLDSEEDGSITVGCAGGADTHFRLKLEGHPVLDEYMGVKLSISGLLGGHSGLDINKSRLNAIKALAEILQFSWPEPGFRLASINGGSARNAIPREASVDIFLPEDSYDDLMKEIAENMGEFISRYGQDEESMEINIRESELDRGAFSESDSQKIVSLIQSIPSDVIEMSPDIEGLVQTSTNLGVISTMGWGVEVVSCSRSSVQSELKSVQAVLYKTGSLAGAEVLEVGGYPGWKPDLNSAVLKTTIKSYKKLFNSEPEIKAMHAGLECGLIGEKIPGIDMVSFGPEIMGAHSPDERLQISSTQKTWELLKEVLKASVH
ncbi:MAG TPA: aminoacyl-histidine dipeptidase [bacterium]|jgi:dipeptidase D